MQIHTCKSQVVQLYKLTKRVLYCWSIVEISHEEVLTTIVNWIETSSCDRLTVSVQSQWTVCMVICTNWLRLHKYKTNREVFYDRRRPQNFTISAGTEIVYNLLWSFMWMFCICLACLTSYSQTSWGHPLSTRWQDMRTVFTQVLMYYKPN